MGDSEKPFACSSPGCNMSFTNEDHLVVHKKKHDMILNLGSNGKTTFVADQTPTPTRFIRNCEEVGLFQDLQNVNPFEETFRRAVEDGKTVPLSESESASTDDTLHTPHIFPNISESPLDVSELAKAGTSEESESPEMAKRLAVIVEEKKIVEIVDDGIMSETEKFIAPKMMDSARPAPNISVNGQDVQLLLKTADGKLMQLSVLPICDNRSGKIAKTTREVEKKIATPTDSAISDRLTLAKMRLKETLTKNNSTSNNNPSPNIITTENTEKSKNHRSREKNTATSEQRRKQDVLARNRASSMRARAKRKAWIQQLQRAANIANERNASLQLEVKALKFEVAKLRASLLAHQHCPVTKAMENGSAVNSPAKNTSIVQKSLKNFNIAQQSSSSRRKKLLLDSRETPIAPKLPKLTASNNYAILPKIDATKREYIVQDSSSMLKIVEVRKFPADSNQTSKRIILTDNPSKRLEFFKTSSRQIIHINSSGSMQIDNAASKCTGT